MALLTHHPAQHKRHKDVLRERCKLGGWHFTRKTLPQPAQEPLENCAGKVKLSVPDNHCQSLPWETFLRPPFVRMVQLLPRLVKKSKPALEVHLCCRRIFRFHALNLCPSACKRHYPGREGNVHVFGPQNIKDPINHRFPLACIDPHLMTFPCFTLPCLLVTYQQPRQTKDSRGGIYFAEGSSQNKGRVITLWIKLRGSTEITITKTFHERDFPLHQSCPIIQSIYNKLTGAEHSAVRIPL